MLERKLSPRIVGKTAEIISNLRLQPFKDKRAQRLYEQWYERAPLIPSKIKDEIGILWMTGILGVDEKTANKFIEGDWEAWEKIGHLHAGGEGKTDVEKFWNGVGNLVPGFISKRDLNYLAKVDDGGWGAWKMICVFNFVGWYDSETASGVIKKLSNNAHCFK